jgi:predicted nicotinamide N-methyase
MSWRHSTDPDYLKNRTVLELGSGTGLVGLAVGLLEPSAKVYITDQK